MPFLIAGGSSCRSLVSHKSKTVVSVVSDDVVNASGFVARRTDVQEPDVERSGHSTCGRSRVRFSVTTLQKQQRTQY